MEDPQQDFERQQAQPSSYAETTFYFAGPSDKIYPAQRPGRFSTARIVRIIILIVSAYFLLSNTWFFLTNFERASYGINGWILLILAWLLIISLNFIIGLLIKLQQTKKAQDS